MKKVFATGLQLRKAIDNYLKGVTGEKNANIFRIKDLVLSSFIDKMMAISIYHAVARDPNKKLENIIRLLDKKLMEYRPYPFQTQSKDTFSIALHVYRLRTLMKYNLPYQQTVQILIEHILIDQLSEIDLLTLLTLLEYHPPTYSKSFHKLVANILDLLEEHLTRLTATPSFITSVSKSLSKSAFRLTKTLETSVNEAIDRALPHFNLPQTMELSHHMREKSLLQWIQAGNYDMSLVRKRVIYQYVINKQYPGMQFRSFLPGRQWKNATQLEEAVKCVRSLGVKQAYIDIFPTIEAPYTNPLQGYATLERPQFVNQYIEHIFTFIKNGFSKIGIYSLYKMVRTIKSLFSGSANSEPSRVYFEGLCKRYKINLINLMVVLYEIGRYQIPQSAELQKATGQLFDIVISVLTPEYLQSFPYKDYKYQELILLFSFVYCKTVDYLTSQTQPIHNEFFKKMEVLLQSQKEKKHEVNEYSKLLAFHRYAKSLSQKKGLTEGTQADILLKEELNINQIKQLLQPYSQINQKQNEINVDQLESFLKKYKIISNVLFQPNLQVQYAIVSKETTRIIAVFQYKVMVYDKISYQSIEQYTENNVNIILEDRDLTLRGLWKKNFFKYFYKSQYLYSRTELQFSYKLNKKIEQLSKQ